MLISGLGSDCLTASLAPLKPFPLPPTNRPTFEIAEFEGLSEKDVHPYTTFVNHMYVYPQSLNFDTQKIFTRARNIACVVEVRDSDNEEARGLPVRPVFIEDVFVNVAVLVHLRKARAAAFGLEHVLCSFAPQHRPLLVRGSENPPAHQYSVFAPFALYFLSHFL